MTNLPKTPCRIKRSSKATLNNPADGYGTVDDETVFEGLVSIEDISSNSNFDKYFLSGEQNKKRFIAYLSLDMGVQTDDRLEFNLSNLGRNRGTVDEGNIDFISAQIKVPLIQSSLPIMGSRHVEAFAISDN